MTLRHFDIPEYTSIFLAGFSLFVVVDNTFPLDAAYSQTVVYCSTCYSSNTTWTDNLNNVRVYFTYIPQKPTIDTPTELKFIVQNLHNDNSIQNLLAIVVVTSNSTGQQKTFKLTNVAVPNGEFSLKYLFPDPGTYQVIAKIGSKNDFVTLASFIVLVPIQAGTGATSLNNPSNSFAPSLNDDSGNPNFGIKIDVLIAIGIAAGAIILVVMMRKRRK